MKEIIELNNKILIEAPGLVQQGGERLMIYRDGAASEDLTKLSHELQGELYALHITLNGLVPNDFDYVLYLGDYNPELILEFCDGAMSRASCAEQFKPELSIFDQLERVDWEDHRKFGMSGSQIFDGFSALSHDIEPEFPATLTIQQRFPNELQTFSKKAHAGSATIHLLKWREDERVSEEGLANMDDLMGMLIDLMTCRFDVIAVKVDGKLLPPEEVDALKLKTLKVLKEEMPISFIRAMGVM